MSYCDFRLNLFQPFISMKTKIVPKLTDDWIIVNKSYNKHEGMGLKSIKLGQTVQDISLRRFLTFCKIHEVHQIGDKLQGSFVVGQDRSLYDEETYNKWVDKYDKRTENIISVKDAKVGHIYRTICGLSVIYLGSKYTAKWKDDLRDKNYTKIAKVHYVHIRIDFEDNNPSYGIQPKGSLKFIRDMGYALDKDEIDNVFKHYFHKIKNLVYFSDKLIRNPEYGYVESELFSYETHLKVIPYIALFSVVGNKYYQVRNNNNNTKRGSTEFNDSLEFKKYHPQGYGYGYNLEDDNIEPDKLMRIGVIDHD